MKPFIEIGFDLLGDDFIEKSNEKDLFWKKNEQKAKCWEKNWSGTDKKLLYDKEKADYLVKKKRKCSYQNHNF